MITAEEYLTRVKTIMKKYGSQDDVTRSVVFDIHDLAEAHQHLADIRQIQKELRQVKKEITQISKEIRAGFVQSRGNTRATGLAGFLGGGSAKRQIADKRRVLAQQQNSALVPYTVVAQAIDSILVNMDATKLKITSFIAKEKAERSLG
jgi:hypothetical protein